MSNISLSAFAESPRIPRSVRLLFLLRERSRTQLFVTFRYFIVRYLQVLCESTQRIGEAHKQRHPEINWPAIAGMLNVLVHAYFEVDFETVWLVVTRDLPSLEKAMCAILAMLDESP